MQFSDEESKLKKGPVWSWTPIRSFIDPLPDSKTIEWEKFCDLVNDRLEKSWLACECRACLPSFMWQHDVDWNPYPFVFNQRTWQYDEVPETTEWRWDNRSVSGCLTTDTRMKIWDSLSPAQRSQLEAWRWEATESSRRREAREKEELQKRIDEMNKNAALQRKAQKEANEHREKAEAIIRRPPTEEDRLYRLERIAFHKESLRLALEENRRVAETWMNESPPPERRRTRLRDVYTDTLL